MIEKIFYIFMILVAIIYIVERVWGYRGLRIKKIRSLSEEKFGKKYDKYLFVLMRNGIDINTLMLFNSKKLDWMCVTDINSEISKNQKGIEKINYYETKNHFIIQIVTKSWNGETFEKREVYTFRNQKITVGFIWLFFKPGSSLGFYIDIFL